MSTTLKSNLKIQCGWAWRDRSSSLPIADLNRLDWQREMADGAGSGQCDAVWHADGRTLAPAAEETLYLDRLTFSIFHNTIAVALAKVKALLVVNRANDPDAVLVVGGSAVDEWHAPFGAFGDTVRVMPSSPVLLACTGEGWDVSPTACRLMLRAPEAAVTYDVVILGVLADEASSSSSASSA